MNAHADQQGRSARYHQALAEEGAADVPETLDSALGALVVPSVDRVRVMQIAARLLLAVALMAIALRYPLGDARRRVRDVGLLLLIVLPVMAGILAVGGVTVLGLPLGLALVLGAVLCPTDPVLASGIVTGAPAERDIPERFGQRRRLSSVFVAGLLHNRVVTGGDRQAEVAVDETLNQFLVVPVFVLFGAVHGLTAGPARTVYRQRQLSSASAGSGSQA